MTRLGLAVIIFLEIDGGRAEEPLECLVALIIEPTD